MITNDRPYVQIAIDEVDAVIHDPAGYYDSDHYDRYGTFESARDAALTSIEVILDEADYDGEDHRNELEQMRELLERSTSFDELEAEPGYEWFLRKLDHARTVAA